MTTHATTSFDSHPHHHHPTLYSNRTYARTTTRKTTTLNRPLPSYFRAYPPVNICENLLYDVTIAGDVGSATSSSYINSSDHYDNTYTNTYDNPIQYFESYPSKSIDIVERSLTDLPHSNENYYDHAKADHDADDDEHCRSTTSRSTSPVLFYLENRNLAICACIISLLILLLIGLGIFLLNKLIRPVIINTTVNNHYGILNSSNSTTATLITSRVTVPTPLMMILRKSSADILAPPPTTRVTTSASITDDLTVSCPPNRWGHACEQICKPCGLGVCHPATGKCICPADFYGEYCDLWKVNDQPKRGDMMS